jgi:DNA-binding NarL/FixJ family response regulator
MTLIGITVAVGGGRELDRAGLSALIASLPGLQVVPMHQNPQVLVWDMYSGLDQLPPISSNTFVLLLTADSDFDSLPETVTGLVSRDESPASLGIAIRQVARGEQYISPSIAVTLLQKQGQKTSLSELEKTRVNILTDREREILDLLAQGLSNKLIATRLYLSVRTVEGHLANIYARLGVHSRTEAMLIAVKSR